jgi:hypothetical protein
MSQSEQLERETEQTRAELAETLEELRARVTPGYLVDELLDYARESSGAEFFDNLKHQVTANPLPVSLMGAGLAWLMMANGRSGRAATSARQRHGADMTRRMSNAAAEAGDTAESGASALGETARETSARVGGAAYSAMSNVRDNAASAYDAAAATSADVAESARRTAADVAQSARELGASAAGTSRAFADFCREQPLVMAGVGIALGAAIGALLPSTETENRLMGEASDATKQRAKDVAVAQAEQAKAAVQRGIGAAQHEPSPQHAASHDERSVPASHNEASLVPSHEAEAGPGAPDDAKQRGDEVERELHARAERLARERSQ